MSLKQVVLKVEGMSCNHCVNAVEGAVRSLGAEGKVDLPGKTVTVAFDEYKTTVDAIKSSIEDQGYDIID